MGYWRCHNETCTEDPAGRLQYDFESKLPVCPKCGTDRRKPEHSNMITELVCMHYFVQDKNGPIIGSRFRYRIACDPNLKVLGGNDRAAGDPHAVNCTKCKGTPEWIDAAVASRLIYDYDVGIDEKGQKYVIDPKVTAPTRTDGKDAPSEAMARNGG